MIHYEEIRFLAILSDLMVGCQPVVGGPHSLHRYRPFLGRIFPEIPSTEDLRCIHFTQLHYLPDARASSTKMSTAVGTEPAPVADVSAVKGMRKNGTLLRGPPPSATQHRLTHALHRQAVA